MALLFQGFYIEIQINSSHFSLAITFEATTGAYKNMTYLEPGFLSTLSNVPKKSPGCN